MQIHELKRKTKNKKNPKIGRGGKRGKTSGKGHKGQKSRAGRKLRPESRDMIKKLPKLRGRGKNINKAFAEKAFAVNLNIIESHFSNGDRVTPAVLVEKNLAKKNNGRTPIVKILGNGELTKKVEFKNCLVSEKARLAIEKVGGKIV